jgi:hypothetical protein
LEGRSLRLSGPEPTKEEFALLEKELRNFFDEFQKSGMIMLTYRMSVFVGTI